MQNDNSKNLNHWQRLRQHYWLSLLFDASIIILIFIGISFWQARDLLPDGDGRLAPGFALPDRNGKQVSLKDYQGKRVIVYFFAPWCKICAMSIHNLVDVTASNDPDLKILALGVAYDDPAEVWKFADKHELQMPVLLGANQQMTDWKINAFPSYYVLDEAGRIISRSVGYSTEAGIRWRSRQR